MAKERLRGETTHKRMHAGFTTDGVPAKLSMTRTMRVTRGRRLAMTGGNRRRLEQLDAAIEDAQQAGDELGVRRRLEEKSRVERRIARVLFLDTTDLRYNLHLKVPQPTSQAVMFCLMDVSGSMDQQAKDMAKRFFLLLHLFLKQHYQKTEIVFIRHHTIAKEVDEQEFFYSRETDGTVVSSALRMMDDIVRSRYSPEQWNVYAAQASDGDNWNDDSPLCGELLRDAILPAVQYFTYEEITRRAPQALWYEYERIGKSFERSFAQRQIRETADILAVFHDLFSRETNGP